MTALQQGIAALDLVRAACPSLAAQLLGLQFELACLPTAQLALTEATS